MNINEKNKKFITFFIKTASPYRWWFLGMLFVGVYSSVHSVVQPYILKVILDRVSHTSSNAFITDCLPASLLLIGLGFLVTAVWRFYNYIVLKSLPKIKADIVTLTTEYLRNQSYAFYQDTLSGDISAKIADLTSNIQSVVNSWFNISRQGLTIALSILMVGTVSVYFSLLFFLVSIVFIYLSYYCASSIKPYAANFAKARAKYIGAIVDCFSNILSMFLFARENHESQYLEEQTQEAVDKETSMQFKNMLNASLLGFFAWLLQGGSILLLVFLGAKGKITVGDFAFIFVLSITVIDQIWYLTESLLTVGEQVGICQNALDTIFTKHQQKFNPPDAKLNIDKGSCEFKHVSFAYPSGEDVIRDLSIKIKGGEKIGLVGYSGAGKSTLVQLLTRLYDIENGEILIDGQDINSIFRQNLREKIAFIPQDPTLFHRSIFENIAYGQPNASEEAVFDAAKKAHAEEFINQLPYQYQTIVGERGVKLSGGQRQRIAIARAILKDAPILILDEATSALDSMTEQLIKDSLSTAMEDRTVIVIAHRLSTLLSMDRIFVIDNGQVIESGSHYELIDKKGFYSRLWDAQSGHSKI